MDRDGGLALSAVLLPSITAAVIAPRVLVAVIALIIVPGYVTARHGFADRGSSGVAAAVTGAALLALAVYTASWLGVPVNTYTLAVYGAGFTVWYLYRCRPWKAVADWDAVGRDSLYLAGIALVAVVTRLGPVREMHAPLFADPAVEGTLAQLITTTGSLPGTWEPFAPIALHHQPGFASITAAVHLFSGVPIPRVVLVVSALIHATFPLAVYVLADRFLARRDAVIAAFVALLAAFPTYSFVAGMNSANLGFFMAVVLAAMSIRYLRSPSRDRLLLVAVTAAGTVLVHPLGLVVLGFLLAPGAVKRIVAARRDGLHTLHPVIVLGGAVAVVPVLLSFPHYRPLLEAGGDLAAEQFAIQSNYILPDGGLSLFHLIEPFYVNFINTAGGWYIPAESGIAAAVYNPLGTVLLIAATITVYRVYGRLDWTAMVAVSWYGLLLLFSTVQAALRIEFPLHTFIYPSRVKFLFVIPIAVLSAAALRTVEVDVRGRTVPILIAAVLVLSPVGLYAVFSHMDDLAADPVVAETDKDAIQWLDDHAARDELVLNTVTDVEAGAFIGGPGQWIPSYTGNPVVFPATSITGDVSELQGRRRFMQALRNTDSEQFTDLLQEYGVSYIYLSENSMSGRGTTPQFDPVQVRGMCSCTTVYENEDVTVLEVAP